MRGKKTQDSKEQVEELQRTRTACQMENAKGRSLDVKVRKERWREEKVDEPVKKWICRFYGCAEFYEPPEVYFL